MRSLLYRAGMRALHVIPANAEIQDGFRAVKIASRPRENDAVNLTELHR